eukprot:CAMPEP_0197479108 /NCGR_PEP_ID=MMETSP1309-20131121/31679_1 /TAXON_ID=464262 /ORGANISM="Genus nov. species nov., Strain RCC998" /LENGTH=451 /DNA_ID=CAMNT_0043020689 /DNA_START=46 /DNA_END=1398 /DNA_ORIENTATION=-
MAIGKRAGIPTTCGSSSRLSSSLAASTPARERGRKKQGNSRCWSTSPSPSSSVQRGLGAKEVETIREEFPILKEVVHSNKPLIYLDNAATSQKPLDVLKVMEEYYNEYNSNVHRGVHALSAKATDRYEEAREKVARFVGAGSSREIVFTRNASEAINLVAYTWGLQNLKEGDEVVLSVAEHHSNIVPWQLISRQTKCVLKYVYLDPETQMLDMNQMESAITEKTKLVTVGHVSNVLGCVNPVEEIVQLARRRGAKVLLDACQSVPHMPVDFEKLQVDFAVCSGHKMCAPTGIGFLWGRMDLLQELPPFMGGGEMIQDVYEDHSTFAMPPGKFEAGTPAICEAIGLGAACDYLDKIGMQRVEDFEHEMGTYMYEELVKNIEGIKIYGPNPKQAPRAALAAFNVEGLHATDMSMILDQYGIAIRSGHHCTQPLHHYLGINATARASLYLYNTK